MRILRGVEIPLTISVSYTILSVANAVLNLLAGREDGSHWNSLMMLLWTSIAVLILSLHHLFADWSPAAMILIQYLIAMGLVLLTVFVSGFFTEISPGGYLNAAVNFTAPYAIGGLLYYISVFRTAGRQNKQLQEIKARDRDETL